MYKKIQIYYFSGTGNSQNVATWFQNVAIENACECEIINIAKINRRNLQRSDNEVLIVFVSPVHGFNYPPIMLHFLYHFPKGNNRVIFMNTRAGMLIGKWITPGLTGIAFYLSSLFLILKGYKIKGMFPVDLPSNWISIHPGLNKRTITYLHERNKEKVTVFALKILSGKTDFRCVREIVQDTLIAPIALMYYFVGRFLFSKSFYASKDCDNCGLCSKNCPVQAIISVDNRPYWTFNCESCMKCMSYCHTKAIETAHGFIISSLILIAIIMEVLFALFEQYFGIINGLLHFILNTFLTLVFLGIGYRIVHYLMRFRFFERMMVYSSLTKLKFWGRRYKALKYDKERKVFTD
jgi:ferredoxin